MAKLRRPSQRSIDLYNQLVARRNQVRKTLSRVHKKAEETLTAGRLPALVIPKRARKIRPDYFTGVSKAELKRRLKKFWANYRRSRDLFSQGVNSYLKATVFKGYKDLWQEQIGSTPEGNFGRFSDEQIQYSDMGRAMEVYNILFTHGVEFFMALLYTNRITEFKYIYDDLVGKVERNYYLDDQVSKVVAFLKPSKRGQLYETASFLKDLYNHAPSALKKAKKEEDEDLKKAKK